MTVLQGKRDFADVITDVEINYTGLSKWAQWYN